MSGVCPEGIFEPLSLCNQTCLSIIAQNRVMRVQTLSFIVLTRSEKGLQLFALIVWFADVQQDSEHAALQTHRPRQGGCQSSERAVRV